MTTTPEPPPLDYDGIYHGLFRHRAMIAELLAHFVPASWSSSLNHSTLDGLINTRHPRVVGVDGQPQKREGDLVFRLDLLPDPTAPGARKRRKPRKPPPPTRALVALEFQSSPDPRMGVRMLVYAGLLWQQADKADRPIHQQRWSDPLPVVLPIVLFNGADPWSDVRPLSHRLPLAPSNPLRAVQPEMNYHLIDLKTLTLHQPPRGPCETLFALEQARDPDQVGPLIDHLIHLLGDGPDHASLRDAFAEFILHILGQRFGIINRDAVLKLKELRAMLDYNIEQWMLRTRKELAQEVKQEVTEQIKQEVTEQIKQELTQEVTEEVTHKVTQEVTHKVTQQVTHKVTQQVTAQELQRLFTRRLQRPLTDDEAATIETRLEVLGLERLEDLVLDSNAESLAAWLADPEAR